MLFRSVSQSRYAFFSLSLTLVALFTLAYASWLSPALARALPKLVALLDLNQTSVLVLGLGQFLLYVGLAFLLSITALRRVSLARFIVEVTTGFVVLMGIVALMIFYSEGVSPLLLLSQSFARIVEEFAALQSTKDTFDMDLFALYRPLLLDWILSLFLSFQLLSVWTLVLVNVSLARRSFFTLFIAQRPQSESLDDSQPMLSPSFAVQPVFAHFPLFTHFRLPFYGVWIVIGLISLALIHHYVMAMPPILIGVANCLVLILGLYLLQGLSIFAFFMRKWQVGFVLQLATYLVMLFLMQPLLVLWVGVGFFDSWLDIRRLDAPKEEKSGSHSQ